MYTKICGFSVDCTLLCVVLLLLITVYQNVFYYCFIIYTGIWKDSSLFIFTLCILIMVKLLWWSLCIYADYKITIHELDLIVGLMYFWGIGDFGALCSPFIAAYANDNLAQDFWYFINLYSHDILVCIPMACIQTFTCVFLYEYQEKDYDIFFILNAISLSLLLISMTVKFAIFSISVTWKSTIFNFFSLFTDFIHLFYSIFIVYNFLATKYFTVQNKL